MPKLFDTNIHLPTLPEGKFVVKLDMKISSYPFLFSNRMQKLLSWFYGQLNGEMCFSNLGEIVFTGAQISAPLLRATPAVHEIGTRQRPLLLRLWLHGSTSCNKTVGVLWRYGALNTLTCSWRNWIYSIASRRTDAVSVFPYGETSCCKAIIRSPSLSFLSLEEIEKSVLCRLGVSEVRALSSTEHRVLFCSIIVSTSITSAGNLAEALQRELAIIPTKCIIEEKSDHWKQQGKV